MRRHTGVVYSRGKPNNLTRLRITVWHAGSGGVTDGQTTAQDKFADDKDYDRGDFKARTVKGRQRSVLWRDRRINLI
jgi:hypothetical protein